MKKRFLSMLMAVSLIVGLLPVTVMAEELVEEAFVLQETTVVSDVELPENDELYEGYLEELFFGKNKMALFGTTAGNKLSGDEKAVYDALKPLLIKIANGERESTQIAVGQSFKYNGTTYMADAKVTFTGTQKDFDYTALVDALLMDLPYDLYWYNKTIGCPEIQTWTTGSGILQMIFPFTPANDYAGDSPYTVDVEKQAIASTAAENAKEIVQEYRKESDYEKLKGYKEKICRLVWYEQDAADGVIDFNVDIDPWQLISVFDGDPTTHVVCEGYSKAFQYLCELSDFKEDTVSYLVTGSMTGDISGPHMWNIVTLKGKNYMVDVTNSDAGSIGVNGELFLTAPTSGSPRNGYTFAITEEDSIFYEYDKGRVDAQGNREMDMFAMLGEEVLTLAESSYVNAMPTPVLGIVTDELIDGYRYTEGYPYYKNTAEDLPAFEADIVIYGPDGEWYDSYVEEVDGTIPVYEIELGCIPEEEMTSGTYTITVQFLAPEGSGYADSEIAEIEFDYTHPGESYATPSVEWDGEAVTVTGEDVSAENFLVAEISYMKSNGSVQNTYYIWSYYNFEEFNEEIADCLDRLKKDVEEKAEEDESFIDGKYICRVRVASDDIFEIYHSDYSDWCELAEKTVEPVYQVSWDEDGIPVVDIAGYKNVAVIAVLYDAEGRYLGGVWTDENSVDQLSELKNHADFEAAAEVKVFVCDHVLNPLFAASARP